MMSTKPDLTMETQFSPENMHLDSQDVVNSAYDDYVEGLITYEEMDQIVSGEMNHQTSLEVLYGVWNSSDVY